MLPSKKNPNNELKISRYLRLIGLAFLLILVVFGALSVPFVYESQTLWYKLGFDKTVLRAAKMAGLLASVLLLVQIRLAVRGRFLEDLFGVASLMRYHRINGIIVLFLATCHVVLVVVPEGLGNLPLGSKHLPEMVGAVLLFGLFFMVIPAYFRDRLRLKYTRWRNVHRFLGYFLLVLLSTHILYVSESFEQDVPRALFLTLVLGLMVRVLLIKKQ